MLMFSSPAIFLIIVIISLYFLGRDKISDTLYAVLRGGIVLMVILFALWFIKDDGLVFILDFFDWLRAAFFYY